MKRAVVFAHYDKDNIVDDYVLYYLKALKEVASYIIFVSCNPIENKGCLEGIADYIIDERHNEYDFGSYKRGVLYLKENNFDIDELILANDSCYGPFFPLRPTFEKMGKYDFWGFSENKIGLKAIGNNKYKTVKRPHLQSYFTVLKKSVFTSKAFENFINSVKYFENKNDIIINYEIGLSEIIRANGFSSGCYQKHYQRAGNSIIFFWRPLIKRHKMPFLKCSILRHKNDFITCSDNWENIITSCSNYPISLIQKNLQRTSDADIFINIPSIFKIAFFNLLVFSPRLFKRVLSKLLRLLYKTKLQKSLDK